MTVEISLSTIFYPAKEPDEWYGCAGCNRNIDHDKKVYHIVIILSPAGKSGLLNKVKSYNICTVCANNKKKAERIAETLFTVKYIL